MDQIQSIAMQHGFGEAPLLELSRNLALAQQPKLNLSQPDLIKPKKDRGGREAQKAIESLRKAEKALLKAREQLEDLKFSNPYAHVGMPNPAKQHADRIEEAAEAVSSFLSFVETMKLQGKISYTGVPDRRKERDIRRDIVCTTIFNFWEERGRALSFTTDYLTSKRGGELFSFVNSIVECMTEPPTPIPGETLKLELSRFKSYRGDGY